MCAREWHTLGHWGFHGVHKNHDLNVSLILIAVINADSWRFTDRRILSVVSNAKVVVLLGLSSTGRSGGGVIN